MRNLVDPTKQAFEKRKYAVGKFNDLTSYTKLLCVDFAGTLQESDIKVRTGMPQDTATGTHPYRFKIDNKSLDTEERARNGLESFDFSDEQAVIDALGQKYTFDMPLWFLKKAGDNISNILKYDRPLIFQSKGCNLHDWTEEGGCTYCFVDNVSNSPKNLNNSVWLKTDYILDTVEQLRDDFSIRNNQELHRIRHSGGEPTIELDFTLELARKIDQRALEKLYIQFDTNLSTGEFIDEMIAQGKYPSDILEQLAAHDVFVYAAFKGTNDGNIQNNTQADLTVDDQIYSFGKLVDAGLEVYPCIYNPDYKTLPAFVDKLDANFTNASKMLRVEGINWGYGPTLKRIECMANSNLNKEPQLEETSPDEVASALLAAYEAEEEENYRLSEEMMEFRLLNLYNLKYKQFDRTQFKIERKD